jgi:hypothetical protein
VVQVQLEDVVLAVAFLDLARHSHFEQLAAERPRAAPDPLGEQVAGELHGDGAEALVEG